MTAGVPQFIGSIRVRTATQLAEATLDAIAHLAPRRAGRAIAPAFAVGLDLAGRVFIDRASAIPASEWLMTCTYRSDPDELADEIRDEVGRRNGFAKRRVVPGQRRAA